jgi:glycerophosphoryl diester phosphodiesterase
VPRPELIAHRGASRERPENTLAAFQRAAELGADGVELDVHLHPDGVLRVHHDPMPAGGATGAAGGVQDATGADAESDAPPTLDASLALLAASGLIAYCELKGPGSAPGTLAAIHRSGVRGAVHAFDHRQVAEARRLAPDVPRGVLEVSYPVDALHALTAVDGRDLWRQWPFVDAALVHEAHAAGKRVIAWTVNDAALMAHLAALGVDALCTDDVALARRVLGT